MKEHYLNKYFKVIVSLGMILSFMPSLTRLGSSSISITYGYVLLIFIMMIFIIIKDRTVLLFHHYQWRNNKFLMFSLLALFILHGFRMMVSYDGLMSRTLMSLIIFTAFFWYLSFVFYNDQSFFERAYRIISLGIILNLIAAMLQKSGFNIGTSYYDGYDRFTGLFSNPNQLAIFSSTTLIYYLDRVFYGRKLSDRIFYSAIFLASLILLVLAGSKTNIIVSLCILMIFMVFYTKLSIVSKLVVSIVSCLAVFFLFSESQFLISINPRLFETLSSLSPDSILEYRTVDSRMDLWRYSWDIGMNYPYIGEGVKSSLPGGVPHSHNLIIDYLRVFGPLGMIIIILFVISLVAYRILPTSDDDSQRRAKVSRLSVLAYLFSNMMSDSMGPQTVFILSFFVAYLSVYWSVYYNYTNIIRWSLKIFPK